MTLPRPQQDSPAYPDPAGHRRRWRRLAREIAAAAGAVSDDPDRIVPTASPGRLDILGSGIETAGFTRADEALIAAADVVFYCVADPATKIWLMSARPDAFDLYVLYDDSKKRYLTYMQMTEAMLHPLRQGRHVVAVFYGHPGIFVLSTHRAIAIARREGHRATMRAAVSALDTLCADLGVDPSQPGMQMFEATDMLIRHRRPDPGLHLVLWQVGLIGELGYRRQGYLNTNFGVLLDYPEEIYGPDHAVINYVGSRYPGIDPLIQPTTIAALRDPLAQSWVTGISTFYIPPRDPGRSDPAMLEQLGLIRPGQPVLPAAGPLRAIDRYGPRERRAFADFATFDVPSSYQWQDDTAAGRFVLGLRDDDDLREDFRTDPKAAVASWPGLTPRERELLARRDPGAIQLAAKGHVMVQSAGNRAAVDHLLLHKSATAALSRAVASATAGQARAAAAFWARGAGLTIDWPAMASDLAARAQTDLAVWSGIYLDPARQMVMSVFGRPGGTQAGLRVDLDGVRLAGASFRKGTLTWSAEAGNATSGYLQADQTPTGARRFTGLIWAAGATPGAGPDQARAHLAEHRDPAGTPASVAVGAWDTPAGRVEVRPDPAAAEGVAITLDGCALDAPRIVGAALVAGDLRLPLSARQPLRLPPWIRGDYRLCVIRGGLAEIMSLRIEADHVVLADRRLALDLTGETLKLGDGPAALTVAKIFLTLDPITLVPLLHGSGQTATGAPVAVRGMAVIGPEHARMLAATPRLGLPLWAWGPMVGLMSDLSQRGGLFLWHGQDRARVNLGRLRRVLARLRRDEIETEEKVT